MSVAFSISDTESYVSVAEGTDTGHVSLTLETPDKTLTVTVDAGDLARALFTASPAFSTVVGDLVQSTIFTFLGRDKEPRALDTIED